MSELPKQCRIRHHDMSADDPLMSCLCDSLARLLSLPCAPDVDVFPGGEAYLATPGGLQLASLRITSDGDLRVGITATGLELVASIFTDDPEPLLREAAKVVNKTFSAYSANANAGQILGVPQSHRNDKRVRRLVQNLNSDN